MTDFRYDYDYLIIGSGFGGSVSALRLAEKGWRVGVLEKGRRIDAAEIAAAKDDPRKLHWLPALGQRGFFGFSLFRHLTVLKGVGVGGGSLVWGAVMIEPKDAFYRDPGLAQSGVDWQAELAEPLARAKRMFGIQANPRHTAMDAYLQATARRMGVQESFGPVPSAIYFGEAGVEADDPYFDGAGPRRTGCQFCAGCMTGCPYGSKNSLDYNYLYLAERRGVEVIVETEATVIQPLAQGGYRVATRRRGVPWKGITTRKVVLCAGVTGTLELLFRCRDQHRTLPGVSRELGRCVRTNSESITAVLHRSDEDLSDGTGISSDFYPDENTHITQNRFVKNFRSMRFQFGPFSSDHRPGVRVLKTLAGFVLQAPTVLRNWLGRNWEKNVTILTVMQDLDNQVRLSFGRRWWWPFTWHFYSEAIPGQPPLGYVPAANAATRTLAEISGGRPLNNLLESLFGGCVTAHILSGCPMGTCAETAVLDGNHEVHGYPGLFVVDGSSIPANIGVNPSLTIAAMAERFAERQPANEQVSA